MSRYVGGGFFAFYGSEVDHFGEDVSQVRQGGVGVERNNKVLGLCPDADHIRLISVWGVRYLCY